MKFFFYKFKILLIILIGCMIKNTFCVSYKSLSSSLIRSKTNSSIHDTFDTIEASKAYYLVEPSNFWSMDLSTQVETKKPTSKVQFLIVNAPSIGIESLIFIRNENNDGKEVFSHKLSSFITYTLICNNIGRKEGWVLKQPATNLAFGFDLNNNENNNCQESTYPYQVEKWYDSLNQQIKDMVVSQLWIS